jgi:hypothetical protein
MGEWVVAHVVQQGGQPQTLDQLRSVPEVELELTLAKHPAHDVGRAERVHEPAVIGARKDEVPQAKLADASQPLKFRGVHDMALYGRKPDASMHRVLDRDVGL